MSSGQREELHIGHWMGAREGQSGARRKPVAAKSAAGRGTRAAAQATSACREEAPGIFSIQLYDACQCASILWQVRRAKSWSPARVAGEDGGSEGVVRPAARSALILAEEKKESIYFDFEDKVRTIIAPLITKVWGVRFGGCDGTQLIRYKTGGRYMPHKDSTEEPSEVVFASRYFTVLCYLNSNFEGGRTSFPGLSYSATPEEGRTLIFPSHYLHSAIPITRGEKFVLLTWLSGPIPIRWI
jgi:hypothetical protein